MIVRFCGNVFGCFITLRAHMRFLNNMAEPASITSRTSSPLFYIITDWNFVFMFFLSVHHNFREGIEAFITTFTTITAIIIISLLFLYVKKPANSFVSIHEITVSCLKVPTYHITRIVAVSSVIH